MDPRDVNPYAPPAAAVMPPEEMRPPPPLPPPPATGWARWRTPTMLFLLTWLSTILFQGPVYAVAIMTILTAHELGHFFQAQRYGVPASLPYFIPFPNLLGTMGAVIAMRPQIADRKALFDIAITGPLAGLVPTLACCLIGIPLSTVTTVESTEGMIELGEPLLFRWLTELLMGPLPEGQTLVLHSIAFAGWAGFLVTGLNLIPIGQLDGGHLLYALLRRKAHPVAIGLLVFSVVSIALGRASAWWLVMVVLLILLGAKHPPTRNDYVPLGTGRVILGWLTLTFIIVGFMPKPILNVPF